MLLFVIDMRTLRESLVAYFRAAYTSGSLAGLYFSVQVSLLILLQVTVAIRVQTGI